MVPRKRRHIKGHEEFKVTTQEATTFQEASTKSTNQAQGGRMKSAQVVFAFCLAFHLIAGNSYVGVSGLYQKNCPPEVKVTFRKATFTAKMFYLVKKTWEKMLLSKNGAPSKG